MNHPFLEWYFRLYQMYADIWLKAMSSVGRYPRVNGRQLGRRLERQRQLER